MKAAVLDIECSDLAAVGPGRFLCAVIKPLGSEKFWLYRHDLMGERGALKATIEKLSEFDLLISYNGESFDLPWLFSRAIVIGIKFDLSPLSYDLIRAFGRCKFRTRLNGFGKPTKSLAFAIDFFGIPQEKTNIYPREHWLTLWGQGKCRKLATDNLVGHCIADVFMTERLYHRVLPLDVRAVIRRWMP